MNIKLLKNSLLLTTLLFSFDTEAKIEKHQFRIAVIESVAGSKEIVKGNYKLGLKKLDRTSERRVSKFDAAMGRCAAKIMIKELEQAKLMCSKAIDAYKNSHSKKHKYLSSIAYSNRGVAKFQLGDSNGALEDLNYALLMDKNDIVKDNLTFLKSKLANNLVVSNATQSK